MTYSGIKSTQKLYELKLKDIPKTNINTISICSESLLNHLPQYIQRTGKILLQKNLIFEYETRNNMPKISFLHYKLSKENQSILRNIGLENPEYINVVKTKKYNYYSFSITYYPELTLADISKSYAQIAIQLNKQTSFARHSKSSLDSLIFKINSGLLQELPVSNVIDWKSGIIFENLLAYNAYLSTKTKDQKKQETSFQEELEKTGNLEHIKTNAEKHNEKKEKFSTSTNKN
jgi:hypothetical protein